MNKTRQKNKKTKKERIMIAVCVILMIISVLSIAFTLFWNSKPLDNQKGNNFDPTKESGFDAGYTTPDKKQINFLIAGVKEDLTDVLMVACVDVEKNSVEILQIPRDTYVSNDSKSGKINEAYKSYGDEDLKPIARTQKAIYDQFKLTIDYYLVFNLSSFRNTVDAMGGIPITLSEPLIYTDTQKLPAGYQVLDGEKAEWFVRERYNRSKLGDIGRISAQRLFLAATVQRVKNLGISEIVTDVIPTVLKDKDNFSSDMTVGEMTNFAKMFIGIKTENIRIHMLPGQEVTPNGNSLYGLHANETAKLLNDYFRPYTSKVNVDKLGIIDCEKTIDDFENTDDNFDELLNGKEPGQKN